MRDAVPPCGTTGGGGGAGTSPAAARATPDARPAAPDPPTHPETTRADRHGQPPRPQRLLASHPGNALGRPRGNPPDEEDPPEQTATTTFTLHVFKTTPEQHSRCVVLPDRMTVDRFISLASVSMHLQVRGAP